LFWCSSILWRFTIALYASAITNSYWISIVPFAMSPCFIYISSFFNSTIEFYIKMVAYVCPTSTFCMPLFNSFYRYVLSFSCSRAMYYNLVYTSHFLFLCISNHLWIVYPIVKASNKISNAGSIQFKLAKAKEDAFNKYSFKSSKPIIC